MRNKAVLILSMIGLSATIACKQGNNQQQASAEPAKPVAPEAPSAPTSSETGHLLGVWYDEAIKSPDGQSVAYEIVANKDKQIFIQVITFTGSELTVNDIPPISATATPLKKTGEMYVNKSNANEFYKVDKKGNLLIYDQTGLVATCKKIL